MLVQWSRAVIAQRWRSISRTRIVDVAIVSLHSDQRVIEDAEPPKDVTQQRANLSRLTAQELLSFLQTLLPFCQALLSFCQALVSFIQTPLSACISAIHACTFPQMGRVS